MFKPVCVVVVNVLIGESTYHKKGIFDQSGIFKEITGVGRRAC